MCAQSIFTHDNDGEHSSSVVVFNLSPTRWISTSVWLPIIVIVMVSIQAVLLYLSPLGGVVPV